MSDVHANVLKLSADEFARLLILSNEALLEDRAALVWTDRNAVHDLVIFDPGELETSLFQSLRDFANGLDQLMVFAFEGAPASVIKDWGDEHGDGLGDVATERVDVIEELAPALADEWRVKFDGVGRVLGDVRSRLIYSFESSDVRLILRADSFDTSGPRRTPIASSRNRFEVTLTRRDLKWLANLLDTSGSTMPTTGDLRSVEADEDE